MIQSSELRKGNWLISHGRFIKITGQDIGLIETGIITSVEGIPLTPEILEKCGCVPDEEFNIQFKGVAKKVILKLIIPRPDGQSIPNDFVLSAVWNNKDRDIGCDYTVNDLWAAINIKHLHKLQNLYQSITGEELEIKELVINEK